jgi:hypothetical protein
MIGPFLDGRFPHCLDHDMRNLFDAGRAAGRSSAVMPPPLPLGSRERLDGSRSACSNAREHFRERCVRGNHRDAS